MHKRSRSETRRGQCAPFLYLSLFLFFSLLAPGLAAQSATAAPTFYVDDNAPGDPAPGDPTQGDPLEDGSAAHPFDSVQQAINAASDGAVIVVRAGRYRENLNLAGKDLTLRSETPGDPAVVAATVIDGQAKGPVVTLQGGEGAACRLAGLKLTGGRATMGGGVLGNGAQATIERCQITSNAAVRFGAGLARCHGLLSHNTITSNSITYLNNAPTDLEIAGGGLYDCDGALEGNTIAGNQVLGDFYAGIIVPIYGGGLAYCDGPIQGNTIRDNLAGPVRFYYRASGGGLYICRGPIRDNRIERNTASGYGGGLYGCPNRIERNQILGNFGEWAGGGLMECGGAILNNRLEANGTAEGGGALARCPGLIHGNLIRANFANRIEGGGGALDCDGVIVNNLIVGNRATEVASGLSGCDGQIVNNTIADNTSPTPGVGGVGNCQGTLRNLIVWGNTGGGVPVQIVASATPGNSDIEGWSGGGAGNLAQDPRFVNRAGGDYRLRGDSPVIDRGSNGALPADSADLDADGNLSESIPRDLQGLTRVLDGNGNGSAIVDMGAYEYVLSRSTARGWVLYN